MENILLQDELDNRRNQGLNVNGRIVDAIRNDIRNRQECLHQNSTLNDISHRDRGIKTCDNCNFTLWVYSYKCDDCPDHHLCNNCNFNRRR